MITRALLDLLVEVLGLLPQQPVTGLTHRMSDFEQVLRCVDQALGTAGLDRLTAIAHDLANEVLETDHVAAALLAGVHQRGEGEHFDGHRLWIRHNLINTWTPTQLLGALEAHATEAARRSPGWPKTPGVLSTHLRRLAPTLEQVHGIVVETGLRTGKMRERKIVITWRTDSPARWRSTNEAPGDQDRPPSPALARPLSSSRRARRAWRTRRTRWAPVFPT